MVDMLCIVNNQEATPEARLLWRYMLYTLLNTNPTSADRLRMGNSECVDLWLKNDPVCLYGSKVVGNPTSHLWIPIRGNLSLLYDGLDRDGGDETKNNQPTKSKVL